MSDEAAPQSNPFLRALALGSARLYGRRALLSATAAVFVVFLLTRTLNWAEALLGFAVIIVVALLAPRSVEVAAAPVDAAASSDAAGAVMRHFADALTDPCLILDARGVVVHRNALAAHAFPSTQEGSPL